MPSIQKMIIGFALLAIASATPVRSPGGPPTPSPVVKTPAVTPVLPLSGDATELPAPVGTFQYAAIGRGIQNYSCVAVGATPISIGAIATLYDATSLATSDLAAYNALPGLAVNVPEDGTNCFKLPAANKNLPLLGNHLFLADGTPSFFLTAVSKQIEAAKISAIAPPAAAPTGPAGTGAVTWLQLTAKPAPYVSVGLSEVYRVETAGGNATPTCSTVGTQSVQYSAQYWFYL